MRLIWRAHAQVLRAICAGFTKNAEPAACMRVAIDDSCRDGSVGASSCAIKCVAFPPPCRQSEFPAEHAGSVRACNDGS